MPKVISIETKKCCVCGKTLRNKSEQYFINEKQVVCSTCVDAPKDNPSGKSATQPTFSLVQFPDKSRIGSEVTAVGQMKLRDLRNGDAKSNLHSG